MTATKERRSFGRRGRRQRRSRERRLPASIPSTRMKRETRRSKWWCSIYSGRPQSTAAATASSTMARPWRRGRRRGRAEERGSGVEHGAGGGLAAPLCATRRGEGGPGIAVSPWRLGGAARPRRASLQREGDDHFAKTPSPEFFYLQRSPWLFLL